MNAFYSLEWQQENPIEGAVGVSTVIGVDEFKDAFPASLNASNALDLQLTEWKNLVKFPGAGAVLQVTYIHYPVICTVKTRVSEGCVCAPNILDQFLQECSILPVTQEAMCVYSVVLAIRMKVQIVLWRLNSLIWGHNSNLHRGSPKV